MSTRRILVVTVVLGTFPLLAHAGKCAGGRTEAADRLESSHLEDMDDGAAFYKDRRPKLILQKQAQ